MNLTLLPNVQADEPVAPNVVEPVIEPEREEVEEDDSEPVADSTGGASANIEDEDPVSTGTSSTEGIHCPTLTQAFRDGRNFTVPWRIGAGLWN
eukprot:2133612-Rhodomonas_salina.2